jgi:hypothetical protein
MYASEHHFIGTDVKNQMKDAIRITRKANVIPHSLEVIMGCGNMWFNPKMPQWARDVKGGAAALAARQQAASSDSSMCALTGGVKGEPGGKGSGGGGGGGRGSLPESALADMERFMRDKRSVIRNGKRTVVQTVKGAAFHSLAAAKVRRTEKLKRERAAARRRDDADTAIAEKNAPKAAAALRAGGGAAAIGWKVRVFWPDESEWFHGTVRGFDAGSGRHAVVYEDGDEQEITLGKGAEKVGFLRAPRGAGGGGSGDASKRETNAAGDGDAGAATPRKRKKVPGPALSTPSRASRRTPKKRADSPPAPPGGLRGSHGIRAAASARRLQVALESAPKRKLSVPGPEQ